MCELMLHLVQLQSQSRELAETFPPFQVQKMQNSGAVRYDWEGWVQRDGLETQDFEAACSSSNPKHGIVSQACVDLGLHLTLVKKA